MPKALPPRRQPVIDHVTATSRVVVVETVHAAEDVIRISIETTHAAWQPEQIIMF